MPISTTSARLAEVLDRYRPAAVMHFAAFAEVAESVRKPKLYWDNNVDGLRALLRGLADAGVERIVFSSSCAVYGTPIRLPIDEATPTTPINPYGETKLECEKLLREHEAECGARAVALRYFNAAGADPAGETGELHEPESHVIPRAIRTALGEFDAFDIFGTDYPTPDGTAVRDYVHVSDLADAHVLALRRLMDGGAGGTFNLGIGRGYSVAQIVKCVQDVTGKRVPVRKAPRRPGDPPELVADVARARAELGFAPKHAELADMVRDAARALVKLRA